MADAAELEKEAETAAKAGDNKTAGNKYSEAAKKHSDNHAPVAAADDYKKAADQYQQQGDEKAEAEAYQAAAEVMIKFADGYDADIAAGRRRAGRAEATAMACEKMSEHKDLSAAEKKDWDTKAANEYKNAATAYGFEASEAGAQADAYKSALASYDKAVIAARGRVATLKMMKDPAATAAQAFADQLAIAGVIAGLDAVAAKTTSEDATKKKDKMDAAEKREREEVDKNK